MRRLHPLGRVGQSQGGAAVVAYLLSPEASYVNGAIVLIDGGRAVLGHDPEARRRALNARGHASTDAARIVRTQVDAGLTGRDTAAWRWPARPATELSPRHLNLGCRAGRRRAQWRCRSGPGPGV
jgi:hypothetical protein